MKYTSERVRGAGGIAVLFAVFLLAGLRVAQADDTDIYSIANLKVKPNILLILDNSSTMDQVDAKVYSAEYDPNKTYTGTRPRDAIYKWGGFEYVQYEVGTISSQRLLCSEAKEELQSYGQWKGGFKQAWNNGGYDYYCDPNYPKSQFALGNWLNFQQLNPPTAYKRVKVAMDVLGKVIYENSSKARLGLMTFNARQTTGLYPLEGFDIPKNDPWSTPEQYKEQHLRYNNEITYQYSSAQSGTVVAECKDDQKALLIGGYIPGVTRGMEPVPQRKPVPAGERFGILENLPINSTTPLAETLADAGLYFAGQPSWFNMIRPAGSSSFKWIPYETPIQYRCQKNYIILITDGQPEGDENWGELAGKFYPHAGTKKTISDYSSYLSTSITGTNESLLPHIAYALQHEDLLPLPGDWRQRGDAEHGFITQNVTTHTIGFLTNQKLLEYTAKYGGGKYFSADDASQLERALNQIFANIGELQTGYSAATVPVSSANKAYAGDRIYFGSFQPVTVGNWLGNIKKYGFAAGTILDANNKPALANEKFIDNAQSYWTKSGQADGPIFWKGGVGEKLQTDLASTGFTRNIYTYTGANKDLTSAANSFVKTNTALGTAYPLLTANIIDNIRNGKVFSVIHEDGTKTYWPLGSFIHSQPLVIRYADTDTDPNNDPILICAGANDGMMHCFNDNDGSEAWAYIPDDLLGRMPTLNMVNKLDYFVDGSPSLYQLDDDKNPATADKKILVFGERRGGSSYTALDISTKDRPEFLYRVDQTILGGGANTLGQSWAKPSAVTIGETTVTGSGTSYGAKEALVLPGGYDPNQDKDTPASADTLGRAVFAVDAQTGALQTNLNFNAGNFNLMTHSIVAVSTFKNPKTRFGSGIPNAVTRIYAGDMNGAMFAFRDDIFHRNKDESKRADFGGLYDGMEDGNWEQKMRLFSSPGLKIFHAPNVVQYLLPVEFTYPKEEVEGATADVVRWERRAGDYVYYGTGDREHPNEKTQVNEFYAIKNNWQWKKDDGTAFAVTDNIAPNIVKAYIDTANGDIKARSDNQVLYHFDSASKKYESGTKYFVLDVTDNLYQNQDPDPNKQSLYKSWVEEAMVHAYNRGWYLRFGNRAGDATNRAGEKMTSTPAIFAGVVYFTTFVPVQNSGDDVDLCKSGVAGTTHYYALGFRYGEAVLNLYTKDGSPGDKLQTNDRSMAVGQGISSDVRLVQYKDDSSGGSSLAGFVGPIKVPVRPPRGVDALYWRQVNNDN